jgi:hypothetical protein
MATYYDNKIIKKTCKVCNLEKDSCEFHVRKISKDGFRNSCKICYANNRKEYQINNKEKISIASKEYRIKNKEKLKAYMVNFYNNNPNYRKEYQDKNREKINNRNKNRRKENDLFRLKENVRHLITNSLRYRGFKKESKTIDILCCNPNNLKTHIESLWSHPNNLDGNGCVWMTWDNYGNPKDGIYELNKTWDIDHIIPLSTAKTEDDVYSLNHYTNLQPLCSYTNRFIKKG